MSAALQTLAVILIPIVLPYARKQWLKLQQYKTATPRPFTITEQNHLLLILLFSSVYAVLILRCLLQPETNIYRLTSSRLAVSLDVLRRRAESKHVTMPDSFWTALETPEMVLLYVRLGAAPILQCAWCSVDGTSTYLYHRLPSLALPWLAHVWLLSFCTRRRTLAACVVAAAFGVEVYLRAGGLDAFNARTKTASDVLFIDSFAPLSRLCLCLWTLAASSVEIYLDARFPVPQVNLNTVRGDLITAVERMRACNSLRRAIGDHADLRRSVESFWARNEEAGERLTRMEAMVDARGNAETRIGSVARERTQAREFIERVVSLSCP